MVVFKVNKFDPGKVAITTEGALYKAYEGVTGVPYDGQTYTEANHLASVLSQLTSGTWVAKYVGAANVPKAIIDNVGEDIVGLGPLVNSVRRGFPVIVLVGWGGRRWTFCGHRYG